MSSPLLTLMLVLAVTFSLPSFLGLLEERQDGASPTLATAGTATLIGALVLLAAQLGWPESASVLVVAGLFHRFVYTPRSPLSRHLGTGSSVALLLIGVAMGEAPVGHLVEPLGRHLN